MMRKPKPKTRDRLLTAGAVLLICAGGFTQGGCTVVQSSSSSSVSQSQRHWNSICTTDTDCEMHSRTRTRHSEWTWKKVLGVAAGVLITGYLYSQHDGDSSTMPMTSNGPDVRTPGVTCVANGCAQ